MRNTAHIIEKIEKGESAYLLNEYEEIAMRFTPTSETTSECYAKQKGKNEYKVKCSESLSMETRAGGKIIKKAEYDKY